MLCRKILPFHCFCSKKKQKLQTFFSIPLTSQDNESMFIVFVSVFLGCCRCATAVVPSLLPLCAGFCVFIHDIAICRGILCSKNRVSISAFGFVAINQAHHAVRSTIASVVCIFASHQNTFISSIPRTAN